jgi:hypothetical protein
MGVGSSRGGRRTSPRQWSCTFFLEHLPEFQNLQYTLYGLRFMFSRISQVSRHLSRPLPQLARASSAKFRPSLSSSVMAGASATQQKGLIHTAACLIIGDEVLGGKASGIGFY